MAGKPFKVGRFAHTLRVRLMQEHIGVDVDAQPADDLMAADPVLPEYQQTPWDPNSEQEPGRSEGVTHIKSKFQSRIGGLVNFAAAGAGQGWKYFSRRKLALTHGV
jgi:phospholipase D1/2